MKLPYQLCPVDIDVHQKAPGSAFYLSLAAGAQCPSGWKPIKHGPCPKSAPNKCKTIRDGSKVSCCCP